MPAAPKMNLRRDEVEAVAEHIKKSMNRGSVFMVYVADDGAVRVHNLDHTKEDARPGHELVGTYRRGVHIDQIEDDLIERLRELTATTLRAA
jgi:predicted amidohydrolase YtcJ